MVSLLYKKFTQTQLIAGGFLLIILTGTFLLMLPVASANGTSTGFLDCLFTATSASCVTGLVVHDTFLHWSVFGQWVILGLIQIGGLGFMTVGVFFAIVLRRKIGLRIRGILQESVNTLQIGGIVRLAKRIIIGTLLFEGVGAILLASRFVQDFGWAKGIYFGIFHSISAFCNAGFDLMGGQGAYLSLTGYTNDWIVNLTVMILIIVGGIGFLVWDDLYTKRFHFRKYRLHTKLVLVATGILVIGGGILFYIFERSNTMAQLPEHGKILGSLFSSVTARTAGFNTVDTGALRDCSKLLTMILMFIGGSPGSTAGGIKTTTLVVLLVYLRANIKQDSSCNVFNRSLATETIKRASAVLCTNLSLSLIAMVLITMQQPLPLTDVAFEVLSAIGTVGMSTGITRELNEVSRIVIIFLMYCGRIGSLSFALSFRGHKQAAPVTQPVEQITIG